MTNNELPGYLKEVQQKMMIDMRKNGYSLQGIADVFNTSKMIVYRLTGERVSRDNKDETQKVG